MHQTKMGNESHFGMKLHIGADSRTGLIHSASVTAANVHDRRQVPNLLHGEETRFYGDSAYRGKEQRKWLKSMAPKAKDFTIRRACKNRPLSEADKATNLRKSSVRFKVEQPFLTLKRLWNFGKVLYRGLLKNANRDFAMPAMIVCPDEAVNPLMGIIAQAAHTGRHDTGCLIVSDVVIAT